MMDRAGKFHTLQDTAFDVLVVGGGATGLGIAVDAATRGLRTALVEAGDFAQATSSRATKLVHGGVRYLASGQISLVYEALHERKVMLQNAPHLVQPLAFVTPAYQWSDLPFYGSGLKLYDLLSGKSSMGKTRILSAAGTRDLVPGINSTGLKGSIVYYDGQFDDARLALALARTAEDHGALVLNYARYTAPVKHDGRLVGGVITDAETGAACTVRAKSVLNATGVFVDDLRAMDDPGTPRLLRVSRGTHIVVSAGVLGERHALMVPKTRDGRLIFAIPWLGKVVIGTTDLPADGVATEPGFVASEIEYLLETVNPFLQRPIGRQDILSVFTGLRPLIADEAASTAKTSREHQIRLSASGMVTVAGGKWTTYRRMAEDTLDFAAGKGLLPKMTCVTRDIRLHGAPAGEPQAGPLGRFGTDAARVEELMRSDPALAVALDAALPFTAAEVVYSVREEMARTVEDVLSRRMRALLLDARAAKRAAPRVAEIMARELGQSEQWIGAQVAAFEALADGFYLPDGKA